MFRRKLSCSFCGKGQAQVAKLVAGSRAFICDRCAAEVIRIMDTPIDNQPTPSSARRGLLRRACDRILRPWRGGEARLALES
jgi:ATP-dependent protease Clp ATPase subunit